jgi:hypothetical protein
MMLHAIAGENFGGTIVHVDRQGNDDRAFGKLEPRAFVFGDVKMVGHDVKLPAGHLKRRMRVDFHSRTSQADLWNQHKPQWQPEG